MTKDEPFDAEAFFARKLEAMPATDLAILSLGAFLGTKGWTPITALINTVTGKGGGSLPFDPSNILAPVVIARIIGMLFPTPPPEVASNRDRLSDFLGRAALGAVEAYAITRPGFVQGIGEILPL